MGLTLRHGDTKEHNIKAFEALCRIFLINRGERFLWLESRRFAPDYCWSLPGGLVELGESHLKALVREVKEELS